MAELEPSKIWAATGALLAAIIGITAVQLRTSGSSLAEATTAPDTGSIVQSNSTESNVLLRGSSDYESNYVAGASGYIPRSFHTNPPAFPPAVGYIASRQTVAANSPGRYNVNNVESDVSQELFQSEYAVTDVSRLISGSNSSESSSEELLRGISEPNTTIQVVFSADQPAMDIPVLLETTGEIQAMDWRLPVTIATDDYSMDGTTDLAILGDAKNVDYTKTGLILNDDSGFEIDAPAINPQQYAASLINGTINADDAQSLAFIAAASQGSPQAQELGEAIVEQGASAQERAILELQAADERIVGQKNIIDQQIQATIIQRVQYLSQIQQAAQNLYQGQVIENGSVDEYE